MLFWLVLVVVVLVAALLIYAAAQPSGFAISREAVIKASPKEVFAEINDFHRWQAWSPWEKFDPAMQRSYSGATTGVGAKYGWVGNKKVGEGSMEITASEPVRRLQLDLHFVKPFTADNVTEFTLAPADGGTHLKWEMRGQTPFMLKVMKLFMDMDKMVGKDFEAGLANLKSVVEK